MTKSDKKKLVTSIIACSSIFLAYQWMGTAGLVLSVSIIFVWSKW